MAETMQYLSALADEIGPRPATTEAEGRAASYVESVFLARGLEPEIQEFDAPRTYSWPFVIYHLLSIISAMCAGAWLLQGRLAWPAFALSAIVAFVLWMDLDTRWGLARIMPKGPSQNVIARHVPKQRRGEKLKRIVIVAHYDTPKASLAFAPGIVGQYPLMFTLMKISTIGIPVMLLVRGLPVPWPASVDTYLWYVSIVFAVYLLVPLFIAVQRELGMPFVEGANDNASGVAAMLGVLNNLVSEPDPNRFVTSEFAPIRRSAEAAAEAGVVPEGSLLNYTPAGGRDAATELPDDFRWADPDAATEREPQRGQGLLEFDTLDFGAVGEGARPSRSREGAASPAPIPSPPAPTPSPGPTRSPQTTRPPVPARSAVPTPEPEPARPPRRASSDAGLGDWGSDEPLPGPGSVTSDPTQEMEPPARARRERGSGGGLFKGFGRKERTKEEDADVKGWLGVDDEFDARKAGRDIGSWDNFGKDDDDDDAGGLGWKGGWAGDDPIGDDDFAANEAARIRRRVTESSDRDLTEKEVWFVATGAEEVGTSGMEAFLEVYGEEVRDALIINLDNVGSGQLSWVTSEGLARRHRANQRLVGLARRVSRERDILVKPRAWGGLSTDATPALVRGYKAMTLMGFDAQGVPANWHWSTDVTENIELEVVDVAVELVTEMIRQA